MDDYISREAVLSRIYATHSTGGFANEEAYLWIHDEITNLSAADVQPVKHGRWIKHRIDDPKSILYGAVKDTTCSVCGKSTPYNTEYCMHCGARMDGDGDA